MFIIGFLLPSILSENSLTESAFGLIFSSLGVRYFLYNYFIDIPVYYWILSAIKLGALAYLSKSRLRKRSISSEGFDEAIPLRPWPRPSYFLVTEHIWSTRFQSYYYFAKLSFEMERFVVFKSLSITMFSWAASFVANSATSPYLFFILIWAHSYLSGEVLCQAWWCKPVSTLPWIKQSGFLILIILGTSNCSKSCIVCTFPYVDPRSELNLFKESVPTPIGFFNWLKFLYFSYFNS